MSLFDLLTEEEQDMIRDYIGIYGVEEQYNYRYISRLDSVLAQWDINKSEYLSKLFDGKLMLHKYVQVEKNYDDIEREITRRLPYCLFDGEFFRWICSFNSKVRHDNPLSYLITSKNLINNVYDGPDYHIPLPNGKEYVLHHGCKLMKALKKLSEAFNLKGFEEYRVLHSQILNDKYISGELYLSIHPFDFMTMSDNDMDWTSCMSWKEHGDYRLGTIEMMNSPCVVEAYLAHDWEWEPVYGKNYTWNNKQWRELFIVDKNTIAGVKGYPFWSAEFEKVVLNWLKDLVKEKFNWTYCDEIQTFDAGSSIKNPADESEQIFFDFYTHKMYNDFYSKHRLYVNFNGDYITSADVKKKYCNLTYSGPATCIMCGGYTDYDQQESKLTCDDCEEVRYCSECGQAINSNDNYYEVDGMIYCEDCYYNLPIDYYDGERYTYDAVQEFYLIHKNKLFPYSTITLSDNSFAIIKKKCPEAFVDYDESMAWDSTYRSRGAYVDNYVVNYDKLSKEILKQIEYNYEYHAFQNDITEIDENFS